MRASGILVFDTALGPCGLAWSERGIVAAQLPEDDPAETRARLRARTGGAPEADPPPYVQDARDDVIALMQGAPVDFERTPLDLKRTPAFNRSVYAIARTIPPGATLTYGDIAQRLGDLTLSRAVGYALGKNPIPIIIPCHRVLAAGAKTGGFSAPGGVRTKLRMLAIEGALANDAPTLFDNDGIFGNLSGGTIRLRRS
ncbi:MAG: methylated-DNA--[protein]-cysteine S-methyltransferase [Rhizobiales bacterium]|nr:methylated-DNA--[protein]-cysteine S-methyltransferase [Hyphomicrobiales bacterium]